MAINGNNADKERSINYRGKDKLVTEKEDDMV